MWHCRAAQMTNEGDLACVSELHLLSPMPAEMPEARCEFNFALFLSRFMFLGWKQVQNIREIIHNWKILICNLIWLGFLFVRNQKKPKEQYHHQQQKNPSPSRIPECRKGINLATYLAHCLKTSHSSVFFTTRTQNGWLYLLYRWNLKCKEANCRVKL